MQFKQMLKATLVPRRNILASLVMVGLVASLMAFTPKSGAIGLAQDCPNPPSTPTFNYWPVTYDDQNTPFCHDFTAIDAALDVSNPHWSQSEADWNDGLTLQVGQQAAAGLYIHNGAANNLDPAQTTAKTVHIITETDTAPGSTHLIKVTYTADNAATYSKSFTIHTPENSKLEVIPNSGYMYDYQGRVILDQQNLNLGNSDYTLGDLDACFEYSLFLTYKFKVVPSTPTPTNTTLSIEKKVKNLTVDPNTGRGAVYNDTTTAKKGEHVGYRIAVTNTGSSVAKNVTVTDNGVNGITVTNGSTSVGTADDALLSTGWTGSLPGTVNLGDLQPGESRIVKYSGTFTADNCPTLVNTASAVATNAPSVSDTASVTGTNCNPGQGQLAITKLVKNNTTGTSYTKTVPAKTNETVNFKLTVTNTGSASVNNVKITDPIPSGLQFADSVATDGTSSFANNTLTVTFGTLAAGQSKTVEFAAKVTAVAADADIQICNVGTAMGDNVASVNDSACVTIARIIIVPHNPKLTIKKEVKNNTSATWYVDDSVSAHTGDVVNFRITVSNPGDATLENTIMTDVIPAGLTFDDHVTGDGTPSVNGSTFSVNFGSIAAGQSKTVEFAAKVTANPAQANVARICNIAKATGTGVNEVQDNACVDVTPIVIPTNPKIAIKKYVKNNNTNTAYSDTTVDARTGEWVNFKVTVTNPGDATLENARMTDVIPDGLKFDTTANSTSGDGTVSFSGTTFTVTFGSIAAGQSKTVMFAAQVLATGEKNICNVAKATGTNVSEVSDDACVHVYTTPKPGTSHIVLSKRAFNDTKNVDATSKDAARGDYITYSLVVTNDGSADEVNFIIKDDLSEVLPLADMVSTNGGVVSGNVISYPAITIKPGETVIKTFKVRIKQTLSTTLSYQLKNTYGNTIIIRVPGSTVYEAPKTGTAGTSAGIFAGLLTAGFVAMRKRDSILKFIFA